MIATVMLTSILTSLALALAAYCAERGLRTLRVPTRWPWVIAVAAAAMMPLSQLIALTLASPAAAVTAGSAQPLPLTSVLTAGVLDRFAASSSVSLERWLLWLWVCATSLLLVRLRLADRALTRDARAWRSRELAGARVWISDRSGPAVVGVSDPEVVVPRRITELAIEEQRLALAHELEHIAARDHWLIRLTELALAVIPWNPLAWLTARRLRSAIEIDCDARVLRHRPNVKSYASLLLNVAGWQRALQSASVALGESPGAPLRQRLLLMTAKRQPRRTTRAALSLTVALLLGVFACDVAVNIEQPQQQVTTTVERRSASAATTASTVDPAYFEFQVDSPVRPEPGSMAPRYPQVLRQAGVEGDVLAQFVVDANGRADRATFKALRSSHDLFAESVREALTVMRFIPAELRGKRVRQLVQQPFSYRISQ